MTKRLNSVWLTHELLSELLGLDDDHTIKTIIHDAECVRSERIEIVVQGPGCNDVWEGAPVPRISLTDLKQRMKG